MADETGNFAAVVNAHFPGGHFRPSTICRWFFVQIFIREKRVSMQNISLTPVEGGVCAPKGFSAAGVHCGVKPGSTKEDLALIYSEKPAAAACVYTLNKV